MNKYPIYIVSKGRYENPLTANMFLRNNVDFKILVEPQEYDLYKNNIPKEKIQVLPFSNLGVGSYPARNFAWQDSIKNGFDRHWCFDDNIHRMRIFKNKKRIPVDVGKALVCAEEFTDRYENIGISGFTYYYLMIPGAATKKPFYLNCHVYSAMLMKNDIKYRWRLKYNEDVDLCLQVLHAGMCTVLFNMFMIDKVSTVAKMRGGNQEELYMGNDTNKKILKARSLEEIWPQYAKTTIKFNRPHHHVDWKRHFKQKLIRRKDIDFNSVKSPVDFTLKKR